MGRRHFALAVVGLAMVAYQVWARGDAPDAGERVASADRPRDTHVPRVLQHVAAVEIEPVAEHEHDVGIVITDDSLDHVDDDGELLDADGLTVQQRWDSRVAELEDQLMPGRGAVQGRVHDSYSGEYLAGVTVTATSPSHLGAHTAITDENGSYTIPDLPPGSYLVTFYYLELTLERDAIQVVASEAAPVWQGLPSSEPRNMEIVIPDVIEEAGVISSHCGSTNTYYVDGIDTTGLQFGDDEDQPPGLTITTDTIRIEHQIDETDAFQEIPE